MNNQPLQGMPHENEGERGEGFKARINLLTKWMEWLAHLGLGETAVRLGTNILTILLTIAAVGLMQTLYRQAGLGWIPSQASRTSTEAFGEPASAAAEQAVQLPVE